MYVHMLNTVQANCAAMNFYFAPRNVVIDFESSMLSDIRSVLPNASVHCCRFHLGQAWWRLQRSHSRNEMKMVASHKQHWPRAHLQGQIFRRSTLASVSFGLSFLPANEVADAFTDDILPDASASDTAMKFADYVLENYAAVDSNFRQACGRPPILWAQRHTNNGAESYHSHLQCRILCKASEHIHVCRRTEEDSADSIMYP